MYYFQIPNKFNNQRRIVLAIDPIFVYFDIQRVALTTRKINTTLSDNDNNNALTYLMTRSGGFFIAIIPYNPRSNILPLMESTRDQKSP